MTSDAHSIDSQEMIQQLLAPSRSKTLDTYLVLSSCGVNLHDTVADIGCGPFTGTGTIQGVPVPVNGRQRVGESGNSLHQNPA